jgi:hypothetical protein
MRCADLLGQSRARNLLAGSRGIKLTQPQQVRRGRWPRRNGSRGDGE